MKEIDYIKKLESSIMDNQASIKQIFKLIMKCPHCKKEMDGQGRRLGINIPDNYSLTE